MPRSNTCAKLAVLGSGRLAAGIAYAATLECDAGHVTLLGPDRAAAEAEAIDLMRAGASRAEVKIEGSDDVAVCAGARLVVVAEDDLANLRERLPLIMAVCPDAILIIAGSPSDLLTYAALKITGLPRERVVGVGTLADSVQFKTLIAQRLKVSPRSVHAILCGEQGDACVPLWSSATVGGLPLHQWAVMGHGKLSVRDRIDIFMELKAENARIIAGKGATHFSMAGACLKLINAIATDAQLILPVSTLVNGYREIDDVCLSLPCIVGAGGAEPPLAVPMNDAELAGLRNGVTTLWEAITQAGF